MKKRAILLAILMLAALFTGCDLFKPEAEKGEKTVTVIVDMTAYEGEITVGEGVQEYEDKIKTIEVSTEVLRLEDLMGELAEEGFFSYSGSKSLAGLLLLEIDGVEIADLYAECFLLYTDDQENNNSEWGYYEYDDGKTLPSAAVGVTDLPLKDGCIYAFVYTIF